MNLSEVHQGIRKYRKRKRIGRGVGSKTGKTAGRGHKGQGSRAGFSLSPTFEGGQMPLVRRVPKRGFNNRWAPSVKIVNLGDLEARFEDGEEVTPETLRQRHLAKGRYDMLKVLGDGELTKRLTVSAHRFSRSAKEKIEKAGGSVVELPGKKAIVKNKQNPKKSDEAEDQ